MTMTLMMPHSMVSVAISHVSNYKNLPMLYSDFSYSGGTINLARLTPENFFAKL